MTLIELIILLRAARWSSSARQVEGNVPALHADNSHQRTGNDRVCKTNYCHHTSVVTPWKLRVMMESTNMQSILPTERYFDRKCCCKSYFKETAIRWFLQTLFMVKISAVDSLWDICTLYCKQEVQKLLYCTKLCNGILVLTSQNLSPTRLYQRNWVPTTVYRGASL